MKLVSLTLGTVSVALGGWFGLQPAAPKSIGQCRCGCAPCLSGPAEVSATGVRTSDDLIGITRAYGDLLTDTWRRSVDLVQPVTQTITENVAFLFTGTTKRVSVTLQARIPPQRLAQFREAAEWTQQSAEGMLSKGWAVAEALAQVLRAQLRGPVSSAIQAFVDRHPEHQEILADRDPLAVAGFLVVSILVVLYELCCFACLVRLLVRPILAVSSYFFCCSRRRPTICVTSKRVEQSSEGISELEQSSACVAEHEGPAEVTLQMKVITGGA